jgi:hypothetical protein
MKPAREDFERALVDAVAAVNVHFGFTGCDAQIHAEIEYEAKRMAERVRLMHERAERSP